MKYTSIILCLVLLLAGCASTKHLRLSAGIASPSEIPGIDDPVWLSLDNWPETITRGDALYAIAFMGQDSSSNRIHTADISRIDREHRYSAKYNPVFSSRSIPWSYGPFFSWHPDGTFFMQWMTDERGNYEMTYFYHSGTPSMEWRYDRGRDLWERTYYAHDGALIGYAIEQYGSRWYRRTRSTYWWRGQFVSRGIHCAEWSAFRRNLGEAISQQQGGEYSPSAARSAQPTPWALGDE